MCKNVDLDDVFAYSTKRTTLIRDRRLGILYILAQLGILVYVVIYQIIIQQQYNKPGNVAGTARLTLRRPTEEYRWANGAAPYCRGTAQSNNSAYSFPTPGTYAYTNDAGETIEMDQNDCLYLDEKYAVANDLEVNAAFLPTRITTTVESGSPAADCVGISKTTCSFVSSAPNVSYVADAEMFTVMIDHSFTSDLEISGNVRQMLGFLQSDDGTVLDPCDAYSNFEAGCPSYITEGGDGKATILSLRSLLHAAGVRTLDAPAGSIPPLDSETLRYAGLVMVIEVQYTNYYTASGNVRHGTGSFNPLHVDFMYRVRVVPEQDYKSLRVITPSSEAFDSTRNVYNQHGVRIILTQNGRIGTFDFQALLINLMVSLGLLSVAIIITDFVAFKLCPLRDVYRQYAQRRTVDFSDLADTGHLAEVKSEFKVNAHAGEPHPPVIQHALEERKQRIEERAAAMVISPTHPNPTLSSPMSISPMQQHVTSHPSHV